MKVKGFISLDLVGCEQSEEVEIDDADMEGMTEEERDKYICDTIREYLYQHVDMWYEVVS